MIIEIISPIKALIKNPTDNELNSLKDQFKYKNTSVEFLLKKHRERWHWKQNNYETWSELETKYLRDLEDSVVKFDGKDAYIRPGSISYIEGLDFEVKNNIVYPEFKSLQWHKELEFKSHDYQDISVKELLKIKHGNISLPTGAGKTLVLLLLAQKSGLDCVIVTPSQVIFNELLEFFTYHLGSKLVGGYGDGKKDIKKKVTIAIGKSLTMLKEGTEAYNFFKNKQMIGIDESHTFSSDQLENVCHGALSNIPYRFFVSATQTRGDGEIILLQSIIGKTVFEMSIEEAIKKGYLCPLKFGVIKTFSPSTLVEKDPLECKRTHFLYNKNITDIAAKIANASFYVNGESTLILVEELVQIKMLVDRLTVPFGYAHAGSTKDAKAAGLKVVDVSEEVERFNRGETKVLIGTRTISTGTNIFPTFNTINWVGGGSEILTKQGTMGRSTRKLENSKYKHLHKPKPYSKIWDFEVEGQPILNSQLKKRIKFYEETGEKVTRIDNGKK
jgi:superfamily II DNA or RNA helicase